VAAVTQEEEYLEIVVELVPGGDRSFVTSWLDEHGFATQPLVVGALATGGAATVRRAFGVEPGERPPVPEALREHVASILLAPRKDWQRGR